MSSRGAYDVAIVGMACRFPGAKDLCAFWENILAGVDATSEVPADRWDPSVFFDPDSAENDRVACQRGGYLGQIPFDPTAHGIMPGGVDGGEPEQWLVLDTAKAALVDAGGSVDGKRVEVIIGRGNYFNRGNLTRLQHGRIVAQTVAVLASLHPDWTEADLERIRADLKTSLPPFGPETIPGQLTSATSGRVANRLDLTGAHYVVDAASASSLVALDLAARSLRERRADLALVGGVYVEADVDFPLVFRQINAASRSGVCRPFSRDADGLVSGEGVGVVVLKRRRDAERDGDRIYAVLKGVGIASDGKGRSLAAPSAKGHARAMRRAYRRAGIDPASVALIEGHGLGLPVSDRAELRAIRAVFPPIAKGQRVLGAVSSMIGHAMPASGIAGLIKTALALHHRVLPPTLHAEKPHAWLESPDSPCILNARTRPWIHGDPEKPRRAGVNAFGFAGINAHAILEEHCSDQVHAQAGALPTWESEAILLSAVDRPTLVERARGLRAWLAAAPEVALKDLAFSLNTGSPLGSFRLGLVARSLEDLRARLDATLSKLADPGVASIRDARGAYFFGPADKPPRVAFLFPGEGSQYPGMLADLCPHFPEVRALFDTADRLARARGATSWPSEHLFGDASTEDVALWSAGVGVNVVLSAQWALHRLLRRLKVEPHAVVGHSSGELLALAAAGAVAVDRTFEDQLGELGAIFQDLEGSGRIPRARLVAVAAERGKVEGLLTEFVGEYQVAIDNCPHQVVIAGDFPVMKRVVERLRAAALLCEDLPFARAYHTPGFEPAVGPIAAFFEQLPIHSPRIPIYSCATASRMPPEPEAIRRLGVDQWTRTVDFRRAIETMHHDGTEVFIDVGARGNLAGFVEDTLRGRACLAVAANLPRRSGLTQLNHVVASLFARGVPLDPTDLYVRRRPKRLDLDSPPPRPAPSPILQVGFPEMSLSTALLAEFRGRESTSSVREPENGRMPRSAEPAPIEASHEAMLAFQKTMGAFLSTQKTVIGEYFGSRDPAHAAESWPKFASSNGNGHHAPVTPVTARPWSGDLVEIEAGSRSVARLTLDVQGDPVAEHHTLGGRRISSVHPEWRGLPVLPFAVMAEMLAQGAAWLVPHGVMVALENVQAHRWIRYEPEPVTLEIQARVDPADPRRVAVAIHNRGPVDRPRGLEPPVFEGVAVFADHPLEPPIAEDFALDGPESCRFTAHSIYAEQWLFHGPALQAVAQIGPIARDGIEGRLRVLPLQPLLRSGESAGELFTDPIILDNFTHLLGGWGLDWLADDGDVIFPLRMDRLSQFGERPDEGELVSCRVRILEVERHRVAALAEIVREDGRVWMRVEGWEDWRFHWPGRFRDGFRQPERTFLGEPLELPGAERHARAVWLEPPGDMGRPIWRDVLEHVQLGPDERAAYLALPGPDFRRTHRLWGRIAAKEAARRLWLDQGFGPVYPADLIVTPDDRGRPVLRTRLSDWTVSLPALSIAHVDGVAVALACDDVSAWVGIDVEPVVERSSGFESTAFSALERALLGDRSGFDRAEWIARLWCAKEAAAKATGLGFLDGPSSVEVVRVGTEGRAEVELRGELAAACPGLASCPFIVGTVRRGEFVWAWTLGSRAR